MKKSEEDIQGAHKKLNKFFQSNKSTRTISSTFKMAATIEKRNMSAMKKIAAEGRDGLVFPGAGGELEEWRTGILDMLKEEGIAKSAEDFDQPFYGVSTGGRIDFVMPFAKNNQLNLGALAMWRLKMHSSLSAKWISDFVEIYKNHYAE